MCEIFNLFLDVNECQNTSICHQNATCDNIPGSYTCTCNPGLSGDGKHSCIGKFWVKILLPKITSKNIKAIGKLNDETRVVYEQVRANPEQQE